MQKLQVFVYRSPEGFRVGLLRNPRHIADILVGSGQEGVVLTTPLASSQAYEALEIWKGRFKGPWRFLWWHLFAKQQTPDPGPMIAQAGDPDERVLDRLKEILAGRLLSDQRLISALRQDGFWPSEIHQALDVGVHRSELRQIPGFENGPWGSKVCARCGSEDSKELPCYACGSTSCLLCLACRGMGEHRACSTLVTLANWEGQGDSHSSRGQVELRLSYQLTTPQQEASQRLLEFWAQEEEQALVWAACGAGKTEVTFALIQRVLQEGGEVLFAIPRQDIVREMTERLRVAFPGTTVASHYSGRPWLAPGELVVATTHQVLHFYQRFQLAILDEVDAFPYQGNEMLRRGIRRALLPQGKLVEMTATPLSKREYQRVITIPARYHGYALPEPELVAFPLPAWTTLESIDPPPFLMESLQGGDHPWLVFAPTIAACVKLQAVFTAVLEKPIGLCHSKVENRSEVVREFKAGKIDVIVTTSVLERGVNFPKVGVIVLYADHVVFTVSALVQIAGRVGRTADSPRGPVMFVGTRITAPMKKALAMIQQLNRQARERGLLHNEATS